MLAADAAEAEEFRRHLVRVGIDSVTGFVTSFDGLDLVTPELVDLSGGRALWEQDRLPSEGRIISYCQTGVRNSVTASALRRAGFHVAELDGSYAA